MRKLPARPLTIIIGSGLVMTIMAVGAEAGGGGEKAPKINWYPPGPSHPYASNKIDWSGFYGGLQGGFGWGSASAEAVWGFVGGPQENFSYNTRGGIGGLHLGYNAVVKEYLIGLEADVEASNIHGSGRGDASAIHSTELDWSTSLRARIGYTHDRTLFYATGGMVYAKLTVLQHALSGISPFSSDSQWKAGWTIGGGIEHAISSKVTARLEYRYMDLGKITYVDEVNNMKETHDFRTHTVRAGFSVKF
jgi:outer membrane immunogenic protein